MKGTLNKLTGTLMLTALLFTFSLFFPFSSDPASAREDDGRPQWPMFGYDVQRTGRSPYNISGNTGEVVWDRYVGQMNGSSPSISANGTIYVGTNTMAMYAVAPDGRVLWKYQCFDEISSSAALDTEGNLYFGCYDGHLYSLTPEGNERWQKFLGGPVVSSPLMAGNGTIYVGSEEGSLYCLDLRGNILWRYSTGDRIRSSPALMDDGSIVIGSTDQYLYCIRPNGTLQWKKPLGSITISTPAVMPGSKVVIGCHDGNLYCFDLWGNLSWQYDAGGIVATSPCISSDLYIYFGADSGKLFKLDMDGRKKATYETDAPIRSSPIESEDGWIIFGDSQGKVYCWKESMGLKWSLDLGDDIESSPAIDSMGSVLICSSDGYLFCLGTRPREPPGVPLSFYVESAGTYIRITWEKPLKTGNSTLLGYELHRYDTSSGETELYTIGDPAALLFEDRSAVSGVIYEYWLAAVNGYGRSEETQHRSGSYITVPKTPSAPRSLMVSSTETYVKLSWIAPIDEGDSQIRGYYIYHMDYDYSLISKYDNGPDLESNFYGLERETTYVFAVSAYNEQGEGARSGYQFGRLAAPSDDPDQDRDDDVQTTEESSPSPVFTCCTVIVITGIVIGIVVYVFKKNNPPAQSKPPTVKAPDNRRKPAAPIRFEVREGWKEPPPVKKKKTVKKGPKEIEASTVEKEEMVSPPPMPGRPDQPDSTDDLIVDRILELNSMLDEGVIDQQEYNEMKKHLVDHLKPQG